MDPPSKLGAGTIKPSAPLQCSNEIFHAQGAPHRVCSAGRRLRSARNGLSQRPAQPAGGRTTPAGRTCAPARRHALETAGSSALRARAFAQTLASAAVLEKTFVGSRMKRCTLAMRPMKASGKRRPSQHDLCPMRLAPGSNPEIVRLAPQVVQRYAKLHMRRSFSSVETELSHLVSTAEIVIVVDRKSAAHLRAVVEDGGGAGLRNLGGRVADRRKPRRAPRAPRRVTRTRG